MNHNIIYLVIAWSLLAFVGYNVLSVEASTTQTPKELCEVSWEGKWKDGECHFSGKDKSFEENEYGYDLAELEQEAKPHFLTEGYDWDEFYDDEISRESVEEECDASEDYEANKKACKKAYDLIEKQERATIEGCESGNGKWVINGYAKTCIIADKGEPIVLEEWMSSSENTVPEAYIKEQQQKKEREWYYNENTKQYEYMSDEEIKEHNLESESEIMQGEKWGPETPIEPPSEPYPTTEVIEDWSNEVSFPEINEKSSPLDMKEIGDYEEKNVQEESSEEYEESSDEEEESSDNEEESSSEESEE